MATGNKDVLDFTIIPDATNGSIYIVGGTPTDDYRVVVGAANGLAQLDGTGKVPSTQLNVTWSGISGKPTTLAGYGITDGVVSTRTVTAGNGLTGGGALSSNITMTLGTPSTLGNGSTNGVTATSHTHALALVASDIPNLDGSKITTGTVAPARLGTGTADTTHYLRGDGTWQVLSTTGAVWGAITGTIADQTDLITSLNGKSNVGHTHTAADVTSGIFPPARLGTGTPASNLYLRGDGAWAGIPSQTPSWGSIIGTLSSQTDLQSSLNGKANTSHGHSATDTTSGVFLSARLAGAFTDFTAITASGTIQGGKFYSANLGTVAAPIYSFATDTNTGIWSNGAGQIDFTSNGTNILAITSTGLTVAGAVVASSNITGYSSDVRLKANLRTIENPISKLFHIGGYEYDWNLPMCEQVGFKPYMVHEHGVVAQEVQKILPDAIHPAAFDSEYLTVDYARIVPLLVESIKELKRELETLKRELGR